MLGDQLDCPHCNYPYSEEELEALISKSKKCDGCEKRFSVKLSEGYIRLTKLHSNPKSTRLAKEAVDFDYIDNNLLSKAIVLHRRAFTQQIKREFFQRPHLGWVSKARRQLVVSCRMIGIRLCTIQRYFEKNKSKIDYRTIKTYENENV